MYNYLFGVIGVCVVGCIGGVLSQFDKHISYLVFIYYWWFQSAHSSDFMSICNDTSDDLL